MKKSITVAVAFDTYCRARIWPAKHETTVSCMVRNFSAKWRKPPALLPLIQKHCETVSARQINRLQAQFHSLTVFLAGEINHRLTNSGYRH